MIMSPCGLIIYGLTAYYKLHWIGMFIGVGLYQASNFHGFSILIAYMVYSIWDSTNRRSIVIIVTRLSCWEFSLLAREHFHLVWDLKSSTGSSKMELLSLGVFLLRRCCSSISGPSFSSTTERTSDDGPVNGRSPIFIKVRCSLDLYKQCKPINIPYLQSYTGLSYCGHDFVPTTISQRFSKPAPNLQCTCVQIIPTFSGNQNHRSKFSRISLSLATLSQSKMNRTVPLSPAVASLIPGTPSPPSPASSSSRKPLRIPI